MSEEEVAMAASRHTSKSYFYFLQDLVQSTPLVHYDSRGTFPSTSENLKIQTATKCTHSLSQII